MLALFICIRYISDKRKLQKQTNSKKIQKNFLFVVANAIRYPPQQERSAFGRVFLWLKKRTPVVRSLFGFKRVFVAPLGNRCVVAA